MSYTYMLMHSNKITTITPYNNIDPILSYFFEDNYDDSPECWITGANFTESEINALLETLPSEDLISLIQSIPLSCDNLRQLKYHTDTDVVSALVDNPSTCSCLLHELFLDKNPSVRRKVIQHINVSEDILIQAAHDACEAVRIELAIKSNIPYECVSKLSYDRSPAVRFIVVRSHELEEKEQRFLFQTGEIDNG